MGLMPTIPDGFGRPGRTRRITAPWHWLGARATGPIRPLPDFIIIGAQKAGTTSLATYLFRHPDVVAPVRKEIHYFDSPEFGHGPNWYRAHFRLRRPSAITGEASPYYLTHPHTPRRVHELIPHAKLVVMLRNPVDRALSHYQHQVRHGREPLTFEDAIKAEPERLAGEFERMLSDEHYYSYNYWAYSYATRSLYSEQIERWLRYFDVSRIHFIASEEFFRDPESEHLKTLRFLDLADHSLGTYRKQNVGHYSGISESFRSELNERFLDDARRLGDLTGRCFRWGLQSK